MIADSNSPPPSLPELYSNGEVVAMALISEREFDWAQIVIPDLIAHSTYEDWLDCREGFQIGLAMAGVDVRMAPVALSPFLAWCRLTESAPSQRALDAFASMIMILREPPAPSVLAVVREHDFETRSRAVGALAAHHNYDQWNQHREAVRRSLAAGGARVEELPVWIDDFVEWGKCLGETTGETALDTYAGLVLEYLTSDL